MLAKEEETVDAVGQLIIAIIRRCGGEGKETRRMITVLPNLTKSNSRQLSIVNSWRKPNAFIERSVSAFLSKEGGNEFFARAPRNDGNEIKFAD